MVTLRPLAALSLLLFAGVTFGQGHGASSQAPVMLGAEVDLVSRILRIHGGNFVNRQDEPVILQLFVPSQELVTLTLRSFTAAEIEADLPVGFDDSPGTFLLIATNPDTQHFATFDLTIGTVGPRGAAGDSRSTGYHRSSGGARTGRLCRSNGTTGATGASRSGRPAGPPGRGRKLWTAGTTRSAGRNRPARCGRTTGACRSSRPVWTSGSTGTGRPNGTAGAKRRLRPPSLPSWLHPWKLSVLLRPSWSYPHTHPVRKRPLLRPERASLHGQRGELSLPKRLLCRRTGVLGWRHSRPPCQSRSRPRVQTSRCDVPAERGSHIKCLHPLLHGPLTPAPVLAGRRLSGLPEGFLGAPRQVIVPAARRLDRRSPAFSRPIRCAEPKRAWHTRRRRWRH